jgi:tetratricopeptide (TPR) repeat protein
MLSETAAALAGAGGAAIVQAMVTDGWQTTKARLIRLLGRETPEGMEAAEKRLERSRTELTAASMEGTTRAQQAQAALWRDELIELLEADPQVEAELRDLVATVQGPLIQPVTASGRHQVVLGSGIQVNKFFGGPVREDIVSTIAVPAGRRLDHSPLRGRDALIDELLTAGSGVHVLHGLGGGGKSSVALEVAYRSQELGIDVWWVPATDADRATTGMLVLARRLGLIDEKIRHRDAADLVWQELGAREEPWLLVLDNADDLEVLKIDGMPLRDGTGLLRPVPSRAGKVIVTSRHGHPADWGSWCRLHSVGMLSPTDGAQILIDNVGDDAGGHTEAEDLAARLGGLPLALQLAASYLDQARRTPDVFADADLVRTFAQYRAAVDDERFDVIFPSQQEVGLSDHQARQMIGRTWELSLELLERRGTVGARPLLAMLACLADAPVPYETLLAPATLVEAGPFPGSLTGGDVWAALQALAGAGLVDMAGGPATGTANGAGTSADETGADGAGGDGPKQEEVPVLRLHPLVRDTSRPPEDRQPYLAAATASLARAARVEVSGLPEHPGSWPIWQRLVPHTLEILDSVANDDVAHTGAGLRLDAACAAYMSARHLAATGAYAQADAAYRNVLAAREQALGAEHPDTLNARYGVARMAAARGRYDEAEANYREVLAARERVLGADHPDTLNARYGLARVAAAQGRYRDAENAYREVLAIEERLSGPDHPDTLRARYGIARMLGDQGRYDGAEAIYRGLLTVRERVERSGETTWGEGTPAGSGQADGEQARTVYREVLAVEERVVGGDRPDGLTIRYAMARMAAAQDRYDEAEAAYQQVLAVEAKTLGAEHPDTLTTRHWIARMAHAQGRHAEAETALRDVLAARERILGPRHPSTLTTRHWIARAMAAQGRCAEAEAALRDVLAAQERVLGPDHPRTRRTQQALADLQRC